MAIYFSNDFFNFPVFDRDFLRFNRPTKDMNPSKVIRNGDKTTIVHNVVGLSKDDIKINVERDGQLDYLVISGEKKNEVIDQIYSVNSRFSINADEIKGIEWEVKDGLLYIYIEYKEPEQPKLNISYRG